MCEIDENEYEKMSEKILTWMLENIQQSIRASQETKDKAASTAFKLLLKR